MHTFHIPVLGLGYSIDTPVKVARFGISSVVSIIEDELIEQMRKLHCIRIGKVYTPITTTEDDYRAKRITSYLNLLQEIVDRQIAELRQQPFQPDTEITKYFELLPATSAARHLYNEMNLLPPGDKKYALQARLRLQIVPGSIDVNIMSKVDNTRYDKHNKPMPPEFSDAMSALRGFANSRLRSAVVFSAGYNPRLFNYLETFRDFFPDEAGELTKKIIIKVSDYRSALLQGKILAKRGLWVSEFRIESGLNCGGHAFPTDGLLLGPILEDFRQNREALSEELFSLCTANNVYKSKPTQLITVQGGIGTALEHTFLLDHYGLDRTGWGSPFLLVPEATNIDAETLQKLSTATPSDYFLSNASPLGVPFNNFRLSSSEEQRKQRIANGRPGSPCYKKYLASNTEFTDRPICTASRLYQKLKIDELSKRNDEQAETERSAVLEKDCLCEGLTAPALLANDMPPSHNLSAVTICPGPNLAYFSGVFSLQQIVGHIYGRNSLLNAVVRPNLFVNELKMYINYLVKKASDPEMITAKQAKQLLLFKKNIVAGINYYQHLLKSMSKWTSSYLHTMENQLNNLLEEVNIVEIPVETVTCCQKHQ